VRGRLAKPPTPICDASPVSANAELVLAAYDAFNLADEMASWQRAAGLRQNAQSASPSFQARVSTRA
jgi:hypothetical protein